MALQDMLQNLGGFQSLAANAQQMQQRQQQQTQTKEASDLLRTFYKSQQDGKPDYNSLNEAILRSPDLAQNVLSGIGLQDKQRQQKAASDVVTLYQSLGNKDSFNRNAAVRVNEIMSAGGDPKDTLELVRVYNEQGPEAAAMSLKQVGAALVNQGFIKPELVGFGAAADNNTPTSQKEFEYYQKLQRENPELAKKFALSRGYTESGKEQAKTEKQKDFETYKNLKAQGSPEAESFGRAAGFLTKEGQQLSATSEKALLDSAEQVDFNSTNVTRYLDLANRFKASDISGGILGTGGSWREAAKAALGSQDEVSKMVGDWTKIRSGEAITSLPQGPATDADIRLALKPLPENANAEYMDKYLRGLAKVAAYKAAYSQFKSDFISDNGSLRSKDGTNFGKAWAGQRDTVLKSISEDPRFSITDQQEAQVTPQGAVKIGNYQVVEVK